MFGIEDASRDVTADPFRIGDIPPRCGGPSRRRWLVVFPAGDVSHAWAGGSVVDGTGKTTFERLAHATGARILLAFIEGRNSRTRLLSI